jgi:hypothetical protein
MIRHLLVLAFVSIPVALMIFAAIPSTQNGEGGFLERLLDLSVIYPGLAFFAALGAVPYTIALILINRSRPSNVRMLALLATPLALLPWLLFPARYLIGIPTFAVGLALGLVILGLLAEVPREPAATRRPP